MAINFPDNPTNGQTHTASGISWTWDGTTWSCVGVTSSYTLPTAAANTKGGVKIGSGLTMTGETLSADASAITVQEEGSSLSTAATTLNFVGGNVTASGTGAVKTITISDASGVTVQEEGTSLSTAGTTLNFVGSNVTASGTGATKTITVSNPADLGINATARVLYQAGNGNTDILPAGNSGEVLTSGGSGVVPSWAAASGLQSRATGQATSSSLANNAAGNLTITAAKTYALHKIQTSHAAWVTLYTDSTARTNDAARSETTDPLPGSGIIAEVITSDGATQPITPGAIGWNNDGTPSTNAYVKVVNKSGSTADVTVTLHFVAIEA